MIASQTKLHAFYLTNSPSRGDNDSGKGVTKVGALPSSVTGFSSDTSDKVSCKITKIFNI